jgi:hypothetical protein
MRRQLRRAAIAAKLLVLRVIIPLCVASACLSQAAEAVETGTTKATGKCDDNGGCSSTTPIGVSAPGSGDPDDWAMCGILYLAGGRFDLLEVARIEVVGNKYVVQLNWSGGNPIAPVQVTWTCAGFTEFSGVPAPSEARISFPAPVTAAGGGPPASNAIAGLTDACVWAGLEGSLLSKAGVGPHPGAVYTQAESTGNTVAGVQPTELTGSSLSTYAFCYTYVGKSPSVKYEFVPGSSITWGGSDGTTSTITGGFTYNSTTGDLSAVDVKLAGTEPEDATYNMPLGSPIPPPTKHIGVAGSPGYVVLQFTRDLAGVSDNLDPAAGASQYCLFCGSGGAVLSAAATGGVMVSSTPLPGWKYDYVGAPQIYKHTLTNLPGSVLTDKNWCFMTGVSGGETAFNAGLEIGPSVYAYNTTNGAGLYWNCLPFSQN